MTVSRWTLLSFALAGCSGFSTDRPAGLPATWRPFRLAHVAHPELDGPEAEARLARAAAALAGDRWLDAIVVSGRLGPGGAARVAELLAPARRPLVVVRPDAPPFAPVRVFRGLRILPLAADRAADAATALRESGEAWRGQFGCVVLDRALATGVDAPRGETDLRYALDATPRIRLVLVADAAPSVDGSGGLVTLATAPLAAGEVRLVQVRDHGLETWLRRIDGDAPADGPRTEAQVR